MATQSRHLDEFFAASQAWGDRRRWAAPAGVTLQRPGPGEHRDGGRFGGTHRWVAVTQCPSWTKSYHGSRGERCSPHTHVPQIWPVSGCCETPGDKPSGPPAVVTDGFGIIYFLPAKNQPGHSVPIFSMVGCCLGGLHVPRAARGGRLCPSRALARAGAGWYRAWHIGAEVGQAGKVTPSLFSRFPPHCHSQDSPPDIPGKPQPRAKLGMAQISQGFGHFDSWQNYRYRKSLIQKPILLPVREACLHPAFKAPAVGRTRPAQTRGCLCSSTSRSGRILP